MEFLKIFRFIFRQNSLSKDVAVCERIALENNALLLKACSYIYRTRNLATWQYFSSLPFSSMEAEIVWQIFYYLNVGFPAEFSLPEEGKDHNIYFQKKLIMCFGCFCRCCGMRFVLSLYILYIRVPCSSQVKLCAVQLAKT